MDFVSAAPTANTVQTNGFNMRQRQLWGQAEFQNGITIVGGQFWDLMTTNSLALILPLHVDMGWPRSPRHRGRDRGNSIEENQ